MNWNYFVAGSKRQIRSVEKVGMVALNGEYATNAFDVPGTPVYFLLVVQTSGGETVIITDREKWVALNTDKPRHGSLDLPPALQVENSNLVLGFDDRDLVKEAVADALEYDRVRGDLLDALIFDAALKGSNPCGEISLGAWQQGVLVTMDLSKLA
jgi:hypothetical protein